MTVTIKEQLDELNRLYQDGGDLYYKTAAALGLADSELMILYGLCHMGRPCTQKELCERWYLKKQTLHSALENLIKKGIAETKPSPDNARRKLIILTEKGNRICERTAIPFLKGELAAFSRLSETERATLIELTRKHKALIAEEASKLIGDYEIKGDIMLIRQETEKDFDAVYTLTKDAFATAEHADGNEQDLVVALRKSEAFVPQLSLVAEINGQIAGHILFTEGKVGMDTVLVLAPLSVSPEYQKHGVGTALMQEGHKIAKKLGYGYCLVLGSEKYYPRVGYLPAKSFGILVPEGIPSENFMAIRLGENAAPISGAVTYAKEFGM